MYELKVIAHFAAAHQLKMVSEKCENLHGHNWKLEVCVKGEQLNEAGVVMDFGELKAHLSGIVDRLDHRFLNELDPFKDDNPSSERIARYVAETLQATIGDDQVNVSSVTAWESENACATYFC
jgi:6-pyruvoyltetrahydropterin/6-carboxytetrahydropterin synthase